MSDEPSEWKSACPHPEAVGTRWGDPISEERQAELRSLADEQEKWIALPQAMRGDSPYRDVRLTGADVFYLAAHALSGLGDVLSVAADRLLNTADQMERLTLSLSALHLERAIVWGAHLEGANLSAAHLEGANFIGGVHLEGADLRNVHLEGATLGEVHLEGADLAAAHMEGTLLRRAHMERTNLVGASFNKASHLNEAVLTNSSFDQVSFDNTNLTVVDWGRVDILGDELTAWNPIYDTDVYDPQRDSSHKYRKGDPKPQGVRRAQFTAAVRAYRVLAVTLRAQGLNEDADRYTYRAQVLQRQVLRRQGLWGQWAFSLLLSTLAGYGFRLGRILRVYALVVIAFALAFLASDVASGQAPLTLPTALDALQISLNAVHGRVFFAQFHLDTIQSWFATVESIVGIVVEGVFVAMLVQRFFAR